jgi:hypothetical protein
MLTSVGTEGLPVSTMNCAVSQYSGSRAQLRQRIGNLQQRALRVVPESARKLVGGRAKINDETAATQRPAVRLAENHTTTGGQYAIPGIDQIIDDALLEIPESLLALTLEIATNGLGKSLLDHCIGVGKPDAEAARKLPADGRLAAAGQSHQRDDSGSWHRGGILSSLASPAGARSGHEGALTLTE